MQNNNRIYFKNLNAIRFVAAFMVIVHHLEQIKNEQGFPSLWKYKSIVMMGKLGVILFFVLSGFLITFLLVKEEEKTNTIAIQDFYIRRALRIWPLYFFLLLLGFFVLPYLPFFQTETYNASVVHQNLATSLVLHTFFLPNLALILFPAIPFIAHLWSIGVEEQFYLFWPVLNKYIKNKWVVLFSVIFVYLAIKLSFQFFTPQTDFANLKLLIATTPFDCMAIGGLFAMLIHSETIQIVRLKKFLFAKGLQLFILLLIVVLIVNTFYFPYFHYEFYSVLFGILIINFAANENRIFSMENKITNYLGKISFGIYMYHPFVVVAVLTFFKKMTFFSNFVAYFAVILLTVAIAGVSYSFLEHPFIKRKLKFSHVISGENAKN